MKRLIEPRRTPVGGWRWKHPETGFEFGPAPNRGALLEEIRRYIFANDLKEIPELDDVVEDWVCRQSGNELRCRESSGRSVTPRRRTLRETVSGLGAAAKLAVMGDEALVPMKLAAARAAVCTNCPHNEKESGDLGAAALKALVGHRTTPDDARIGTCGVCTCPLKAKVHMKPEIFEGKLTAEQVAALPKETPGLDGNPITCWMISEPEVKSNPTEN